MIFPFIGLGYESEETALFLFFFYVHTLLGNVAAPTACMNNGYFFKRPGCAPKNVYLLIIDGERKTSFLDSNSAD